MAAVAELDLPAFDYFDESLRGDAYREAVMALAAQGWLARTPVATVILDREAGEKFLRSRQAAFPGLQIAELFGVTGGALRAEMDANILHRGGDDHRRLRNLVNPSFTPRAVARWRPAMRGFLRDLWLALPRRGRCEAVEDLCRPYPALTIAALLDAPREDAPRLHHWSNWVQRQFDPPSLMRDRAAIEQACEELYAYLREVLDRLRAAGGAGQGGADLIGELLTAEAEGERLTDRETVDLVLNVLIGGVDTTQSQLAQALRLFAQHPDQWELLREEPGLVPQAVSEVLRYEPVTPFTSRICLEDIEHDGVLFPAQTIVLVCSLAANLEAGEDFDITRTGGPRLLTFGAGIHYCLGANLARAELEEALAFLAPRMPGLALDGEPAYGTIQGIYGMDSLPLRWGS
jgi:cytochrome P450